MTSSVEPASTSGRSCSPVILPGLTCTHYPTPPTPPRAAWSSSHYTQLNGPSHWEQLNDLPRSAEPNKAKLEHKDSATIQFSRGTLPSRTKGCSNFLEFYHGWGSGIYCIPRANTVLCFPASRRGGGAGSWVCTLRHGRLRTEESRTAVGQAWLPLSLYKRAEPVVSVTLWKKSQL